jgi:hypothetical protein
LLLGYLLGREHIKYELRSAFLGAGKAFSEGLQEKFGKDLKAPVAQASKPDKASSRVSAQPGVKEPEAAVVPPPAPDKKTNEWVVAPIPARLGDVVVKVVSAKVAPVSLKGPRGQSESEKPVLILTVELANRNQNRKIEYRTWAGREVSFERDFATLDDNFGNNYKRVTFRIFGGDPVGRVDSESIYPGKSLTDVLVFQVPLENIQHLDLVMPGTNADTEGLFKFRIPAAMIQR